jgi:hypothetical protein
VLSDEVRGFPSPSPWIYRSGRATLPKPRAVRINCRWQHLPLTSRAHCTETAGRMRVCDHYGMATEEPWWPVTSAPTSPTTHAVASPEKAHSRRMTAATTMGI